MDCIPHVKRHHAAPLRELHSPSMGALRCPSFVTHLKVTVKRCTGTILFQRQKEGEIMDNHSNVLSNVEVEKLFLLTENS